MKMEFQKHTNYISVFIKNSEYACNYCDIACILSEEVEKKYPKVTLSGEWEFQIKNNIAEYKFFYI